MNGKGDKRRPTNERKFRENFDEINWREFTFPPAKHCRRCDFPNFPNAGACFKCDLEFE